MARPKLTFSSDPSLFPYVWDGDSSAISAIQRRFDRLSRLFEGAADKFSEKVGLDINKNVFLALADVFRPANTDGGGLGSHWRYVRKEDKFVVVLWPRGFCDDSLEIEMSLNDLLPYEAEFDKSGFKLLAAQIREFADRVEAMAETAPDNDSEET